MVDDNTIQCSYSREYGSYEVFVRCYELDNPNYNFRHLFFSGKFLSVDGDVFYMEELKSGTVYTFRKVIE